jgi:F-type H+-transporting ATP synthase subunit e
VYGWYHRRTIQSAFDAQKLQHAAHDRERLIAEAKTAWKRQQDAGKDDGMSCLYSNWIVPDFPVASVVITDPDDPRFDLEKLLAKWEKP